MDKKINMFLQELENIIESEKRYEYNSLKIKDYESCIKHRNNADFATELLIRFSK